MALTRVLLQRAWWWLPIHAMPCRPLLEPVPADEVALFSEDFVRPILPFHASRKQFGNWNGERGKKKRRNDSLLSKRRADGKKKTSG
uniref:Secreted protein n=1 Tax=Setaria viridis TaxID=4556 RepID=A0A4U6W4K0_SETVI|nr:hypothetical protein SEVIR_2G431250v2 [Setaria viridis]